MADLYRDGTLSLAGDLLQVVRTAFDGLHVRISPFGDVAWRDAFTDRPYLNGVQLDDRATFGIYPLCFSYDGQRLFVQYADDLGWLTVYARNGVAMDRRIVDAASEGIHHIEPNDIVVMGNDPSLLRRMPNGELWASVVETPTFVVGAYGEGAYPGALSYLHKPSGTYKRWLGYTPLPHRAVEHGGLYVFISGTPDSPDPATLVWSDSFPAQPPIVTPPPVSSTPDVALPLPLVPFEACWVGATDGPVSMGPRPGNCEWSPSVADANLNRPVGEGVDYAATVEGRDLLIAKWSTESAAGGFPALDRTITWAQQRGVGVEIHVDSPSHRGTAMDARARVLARGSVPILCAHAVQSAVDFEADARAFAALGQWGITLNYRAHGKDPQVFKEVILTANQLTRELKPVVVWFASWANAGPQMKAYCAEVCRLTPTPVTRPHQAIQSLPPVTPPVTPQPKPPKHGSGQQASKPSIFSGKQ